jgi:4-nitrophenyl phosphatase
MPHTPSLNSLQALVIDMDGVLWRGATALPGLTDFFAFLRANNIPFTLATNNASKTPAQYVQRFAGLGIEIFPAEVMTSSLATAEYLKTQYPPGTSMYVVGQSGIRQALTNAGFVITEENVAAVVAGIDFELTYNKLKIATLQINKGARFIGTNPDLTFPVEGNFAPGAGSILAAISAATGKQPTIIGKPEPTLFEMALRRMKTRPARTAMIGDRLETDILGAQRAGLKTILVLSGVSTSEALKTSDIQPNWVFSGIKELVEVWQSTDSTV